MTNLFNLLDKYQPTAYMFGHSHYQTYRVVNNVAYIQTGAGGKAETLCDQAGAINGTSSWVLENEYGFLAGSVDSATNRFNADFYTTNATIAGSADLKILAASFSLPKRSVAV